MQLVELSGDGGVGAALRVLGETRGICFLVIALPGCRACDRLKVSLLAYENSKVMDCYCCSLAPESADIETGIAELSKMRITEFPGLLMYVDGELFKRWAGFFDSESVDERLALLSDLLSRAFNAADEERKRSKQEVKIEGNK